MDSHGVMAVFETNEAYANSHVSQRLRLAYADEVLGYIESGDMGTDLSRFRSRTDGYMDEVHAWRDQYGADCVSLIVATGQYCGIAYLMSAVTPSFEVSAFSIVKRTCATGYYTFGHELGHNMGCHHDRQNASSGAYSYSYGYRTSDGVYRTIMSYAPPSRILFGHPRVEPGERSHVLVHRQFE